MGSAPGLLCICGMAIDGDAALQPYQELQRSLTWRSHGHIIRLQRKIRRNSNATTQNLEVCVVDYHRSPGAYELCEEVVANSQPA